MAQNITNTLKYARFIALAHIIVGVLLFVFGIIDRLHGYFWTGYGCFGIWCGAWMCITGGLGIPASNRERSPSSNALAGTFMGFAITSSVFGGVVIICYSISVAIYSHERRWYWESHHSEMAVTAIILVLGIVEFAIGIWASVLCCLIVNCCSPTSAQTQTVMYVNGQGVVPGGYVMAQGPGGVPMAFPVQQAGGVATVPGGHTQVVHMPPQGMFQVAGQPPTYQMSTSGAQMGQVPTFGAEGGHPPPYNPGQQLPVKM
ncbi:membrane-spanning 4-domains subfamily A member 8-like [Porites lutea]|uniref:membrane-spanning 4-domains subfamily A member 8-like n=1 Tax=Porites lutea TaxID=51062 RepID=UPI003CC6ADFA